LFTRLPPITFFDEVDIPSTMRVNEKFEMKVKNNITKKSHGEIRVDVVLGVPGWKNGPFPLNKDGTQDTDAYVIVTFRDNVFKPEAAGETFNICFELWLFREPYPNSYYVIGSVEKDIRVTAD
jgi:hypothetical protein